MAQIDATNGDYDPATGHSELSGYGRMNALKAVQLATSAGTVKPKPKAKTTEDKVEVAKAKTTTKARKKTKPR